MSTQNVKKGWITTCLGIIVVLAALVFVYTGTIVFLWDGVVGIALGTLLIMSPETIEKKLLSLFTKTKE